MPQENLDAGNTSAPTPLKTPLRLKKKHIVLIVIIVVLLVVLGVLWWYKARYGKTATTTQKVATQQEVKTPAALDGILTDAETARRHPLAIVVENHPDARPQAGLDKASVVYEAIAEGGITRFLAVFGTSEADKVGPVRSARTFFVDWVSGYNAWFGHVGGSGDALSQIKAENILDLNQFAYSGPYWREKKAGIATEHTMYTTTAKLREQAAKNKYTADNNFKIYQFKDDPVGAAKEALPAAQKVAVNFSTASYNVVFDYDKATNSYKRGMAGKPHTVQGGAQIAPKNIVVMTVPRQATTAGGKSVYTMATVGTGKAKIFMDGKTIESTWKKDAKTSREVFLDAAGQEIIFNRGQFWLCVIPPEGTITVT